MEQEGGVDGAGPIWGYGPAPLTALTTPKTAMEKQMAAL